MKLLQVYPHYPPAWNQGGVVRVVHRIATKLADRGHSVSVYTTDSAGANGRITRSDAPDHEGVTVRYFRNLTNTLAHRAQLPLPVGFLTTLRREIERFDVVHVHGYPHLLAVAASVFADRRDVPLVVTPHGSINQPQETTPPILRRVFHTVFDGWIGGNADVFTALTTDEHRRLRESDVPRETVVQVSNGVDPDEVCGGNGDEFRREYGFDDQTLVGFVGRINHKKGLDIVVECARRLSDRDVAFAVVGPDDGYGERLRKSVVDDDVDNVSLLGYVSEETKRSALDAFDVFAHPSYGEGQPMAVLEACATGTPVVITEQCSLPEIEDADAGIVTQPEPDVVTAAVRELLDPDTRERFGENARRLAQREFSWGGVVATYEGLYESLARTGDVSKKTPTNLY